MNNVEFLNVIKQSFKKYLQTSSRSNEKLKILHGAIANDLSNLLGSEYKIHSLGINDSKESKIEGRYIDKKVDIAIEKENEIIGAIALKFVMSNYSQNSNNYFENMLGETANIRCNSKPYFQIVILPSKAPYFKEEGIISKYEHLTKHYLEKYIKLSQDNPDLLLHTPNKTLMYIIDIPTDDNINNREDYIDFYLKNDNFKIKENNTKYEFSNNVIYNNYEEFIKKVYYYIKSL